MVAEGGARGGLAVQHFKSFDELDIAYLDEGVGRPVVLLHGFAADHVANWVVPGVVSSLVASGRRVVAPDARGHGRSGKPHEPSAYANDAMVNDVRALLDHLGVDGVDGVDLVGYSMGAITSGRLTPHEPRVASLVLGGVGDHWTGEQRPGDGSGIADALEADDPESIVAPVPRAFRRFADGTGADRLALAAIQRSEPGERAHLEHIAVRTLILVGDRDQLVGAPEKLAARIPGATFKVIRGDHLGAVNDPQFARSIVEFVVSAD